MENLSFTTFLKIALLPSTIGKIGTIQRMVNSDKGYDFYKRMKFAAQQVAADGNAAQSVLDALASIKREAERTHNILMANRFQAWWKSQLGAFVTDERPKGIFHEDGMKFGVRLQPELTHVANDKIHVTYLWATKAPVLTQQVAGAGLLMLRGELARGKFSEAKFQILDLRKERVFGEECITNQSGTLLKADLALVNSIWPSDIPKAA